MTFLGKREANQSHLINMGDVNYDFQFNFELIDDEYENVLNYSPDFKWQENKVIVIDFEDTEKNYIKRGKQVFKNYLNIIQIIKE